MTPHAARAILAQQYRIRGHLLDLQSRNQQMQEDLAHQLWWANVRIKQLESIVHNTKQQLPLKDC